MTEDQKTIQEQREHILVLEQQLDWLKRQLFGKKGEQFHHPDLFGDSESGKSEASSEEEQPEEEDDTRKTRKSKKRKTRSAGLPKDLLIEIHLPKQTMCDAALKVADQLGVLNALMKRDMLACGYIRANETEAPSFTVSSSAPAITESTPKPIFDL